MDVPKPKVQPLWMDPSVLVMLDVLFRRNWDKMGPLFHSVEPMPWMPWMPWFMEGLLSLPSLETCLLDLKT